MPPVHPRNRRPALRLVLAATFLLPAALAAARIPASDPDSLVAALEGGWVGRTTLSPDGPSDFALLFEREADGSLHARTHRDRETWIDLRFVPSTAGSWRLVESAAMAGLGLQSRELAPAPAPEGLVRFASAERPAEVVVDFALAEGRLALDVRLGGEPHASFRLERLPDEALGELRKALDGLAMRPVPEVQAGGSDADRAEAVVPGEEPPQDATQALAAARREAEERPEEARAQLDLGRAILAVLSEHPGRGFRLGGDCLRALERAAELDPTLAEPHRLLALYRLNAPRIGGGSPAKALRAAQRYAELEPERGPAFLAAVRRAIDAR